MSLNRFVSIDKKDWMNIGCDKIVCNELTIAGQLIRPSSLVFSTSSGGFSGSIYPAITPIITIASAGVGSLVSNGYKAGQQLRIVSRVIINSVSTTNTVGFYLYPVGAPTLIQIPSSTWAPNTDIVVESIYTFVSPTSAYFVSTVSLPDDIQNINYGLPITFPTTVPYNLSISCSASGACSLTHVQTTLTLI